MNAAKLSFASEVRIAMILPLIGSDVSAWKRCHFWRISLQLLFLFIRFATVEGVSTKVQDCQTVGLLFHIYRSSTPVFRSYTIR